MSIDDRIIRLEREFEDLRRSLAPQPVTSNWLEEFVGAFEDEPAFEEVLRYGRELRHADRPADDQQG